MKLMRLAIWVAVFAILGGSAYSEDLDIRALQAKLAAQEARLNDLQAKMNSGKDGGVASGVMSYRKKGSVTIGGLMNTRYLYRKGKVESKYGLPSGNANDANNYEGVMRKREDFKYGDFRVEDAKLAFKVDVNEYFDAFCRLDLYDGARRSNVSGIAQYYWVRWKNICNSGFGILVGRDPIKFGDNQPMGVHDGYVKDGAGEIGDYMSSAFRNFGGTMGDGMFGGWGSLVPNHTAYQYLRTTQITPYWESQDGKLKAEVSFIQGLDRLSGTSDSYYRDVDGVRKHRGVNMGLGSMTARVVWKPIEGLKLTASFMNLYTNSDHGNNVIAYAGNRPAQAPTFVNGRWTNMGVETTSNNTAINLGFQYRPCFMNRVNIWGQWIHGWNEAWVKDLDSDSLNFGFSVDITKRLTFFAMGEYLRSKNDQSDIWNKGTAWAFYGGLKYSLPYGVDFEAGWRHDRINYKDASGDKHTKVTSDVIYGHLGFAF